MSLRRNFNHFHSLAKNLSSLAPALNGYVACPICLRTYSEDDYSQGRLTHGHILPRSAGGRIYTLVCAACNSLCGSNQDAHFREYIGFVRGVRHGSEQRLRVTIAEEELNATLRVNEDQSRSKFELIFPAANPRDALERAGAYLREQQADTIIPLTFKYPYDYHQVKVAFLTAAYLDAFRCLGYWYILNGNLDPIRKQILCPHDAGIADAAWIDWPNKRTWRAELFIATSPPDFQCIGFSLMGKTVILPKAEHRAGEIYQRMRVARRLTDHSAVPSPPFGEKVIVPPNIRAGQWTLRAKDGETVAIIVHPDLKTVRRLSAEADENLPWVQVAPDWARAR